jgi:hypothetical protein
MAMSEPAIFRLLSCGSSGLAAPAKGFFGACRSPGAEARPSAGDASGRLRMRLAACLGRGGMPASIADLAALGLNADIRSALSVLALRWEEAAVVRAFVDAVLGRPLVPGTPVELAEGVRRLI